MKYVAAAICMAAGLCANAATAGSLTGASVTLSNPTVSSATDVTIRYTTETALNNGTYLFLGSFPGLNFVSGSCGPRTQVLVNGVPLSGYSCNHSLSVIISLNSSGAIPAGSDIYILLDKANITTSAVSGIYASSRFDSTYSSGGIIDRATPFPTYSIAPSVAAVPTLSEWAMILLGVLLATGAALTLRRRRMAT